jgi:hypothetical protein
MIDAPGSAETIRSSSSEERKNQKEDFSPEVEKLQKEKLALEIKQLGGFLSNHQRWVDFAFRLISAVIAGVAVYFGFKAGLLHVSEHELGVAKTDLIVAKADLGKAQSDVIAAKVDVAVAKETEAKAMRAAEAAEAQAAAAGQRTKEAEAKKTEAEASMRNAIKAADDARSASQAAIDAKVAAEAAQNDAENKRDSAVLQAHDAMQKLDDTQRQLEMLRAQTDAIKMDLFWKAPLRHRSIVVVYSKESGDQYQAFRKRLNAYLDPLLGVNLIAVMDGKFVREESTVRSVDWDRLGGILARLENGSSFHQDTNQIFFKETEDISEAVLKLAGNTVVKDAWWNGSPIPSRDVGFVDVVILLK